MLPCGAAAEVFWPAGKIRRKKYISDSRGTKHKAWGPESAQFQVPVFFPTMYFKFLFLTNSETPPTIFVN